MEVPSRMQVRSWAMLPYVQLLALIAVWKSSELYHRAAPSPSSMETPLRLPHMHRSMVGNATTTTPLQTNDCLLHVAHVRNVRLYSQNDEDGAILQTLRCMGGHGKKEYFEFGSETGVEVNTRALRRLHGWHGHLLDGGNENPEINLHKEWFTPSNIVSLLEKYGASKDLDVLSVDCDYDDFWIMREILVAEYRPRVMIVEYNCNFGDQWSISAVAKPVGREAEVRWKADCYFGASANALIMLGRAFGYAPVWANTVNLVFVRVDEAVRLGLALPSPESFPGPWSRELHKDCNGRVWKVIDDIHTSKATDKSISHVDFANSFADIKLGTMSYGLQPRTNAFELYPSKKSDMRWRTFHEMKE